MGTDDELEPTGFGAAVRKRRIRRQWTVYRLAQKAGLSAPYLAELETGAKGRRITVETAAKLARALGITTDRLLIEAGLMDAPPSEQAEETRDIEVYLRATHALTESDAATVAKIVRTLEAEQLRALAQEREDGERREGSG